MKPQNISVTIEYNFIYHIHAPTDHYGMLHKFQNNLKNVLGLFKVQFLCYVAP